MKMNKANFSSRLALRLFLTVSALSLCASAKSDTLFTINNQGLPRQQQQQQISSNSIITPNGERKSFRPIPGPHQQQQARQQNSKRQTSSHPNQQPGGSPPIFRDPGTSLPVSDSYGIPAAEPVTSSPPEVPEPQIRILPLPIPVGLPLLQQPPPLIGGHQHSAARRSESYRDGLFGGFGSPLLSGHLTDQLQERDGSGHHHHPPVGQNQNGGQQGGEDSEGDLKDDIIKHLLNQQRPSFYPGDELLGNDPVRASILAARSNPLIHLLAAPYLKNIRENGGKDLPTLEDFELLLERSSFGLSGIESTPGSQPNYKK